ncbi:G-type lectin S-receptor-like serine/threonine-protein kinase At4g27290 [Salvia miltiorrhiza]|uniref:G-type lectin S-receptor-like serine/threonine-protein kinase At4g27290 n=1 Tax=Salvia miltiorrhiza TaxID=226208 RepID=UPI0025AC9510|nr:G-type lectin S-receptor-like serine/threonine-protein kinase At4g27290 [Salvia miltiorrhiza]
MKSKLLDLNMAQLCLYTSILCCLLHSIPFLSLTVGAVDECSLLPYQTLVIGQTLISQNQVFEMGFFSPGKSSNRFLGIWYKSTPEAVVWVANRNHPITASQPPLFMISRNGSLVISSGKSIIWLANSSVVATNPVLQLLDSGNLVLLNNNTSTTEGYIWQSFDYPTDTMLPGMKMVDDVDAGVERYLTSWRSPDDPSPGEYVHRIQNRGLAEVVTLRGATKRYRVGQWNGMHFCGGAPFPNSIFKVDLVFKQERLISIGEVYESSLLVRTILDTSGTILRHTMNARKDKWNLAITFPQELCDEYGSCGPNGICRSDRPVRCQCFKGFAPKFQKDWDLQDWSGGCNRTKLLNCDGGDGFQEIRGVKYPDMLRFWLNTTMSLGECKAECFKNCSCTAYANPFITNGGSGCLMWFGDLIDTKGLSAADSKQNIYIRVPLSELDSSRGLEEEVNKRPTKFILVSIASGVLVSAIINGAVLFMSRRKGQGNN